MSRVPLETHNAGLWRKSTNDKYRSDVSRRLRKIAINESFPALLSRVCVCVFTHVCIFMYIHTYVWEKSCKKNHFSSVVSSESFPSVSFNDESWKIATKNWIEIFYWEFLRSELRTFAKPVYCIKKFVHPIWWLSIENCRFLSRNFHHKNFHII